MKNYPEYMLVLAVSTAISFGIAYQLDSQTGRTADHQHQMQSERIDSLEAEVSRLSQKLIDGHIIVIDCEEQRTGRVSR